MSLNSVTLMGRLTKAVELRYTQSQKAVASFTLAVDRDYTEKGQDKQTDFVDCCAWGQTAEFADKYLGKGSMAIVHGRLQSREWTDKNDQKRKSWEVIADRIYFGESKTKADQSEPKVFARENKSRFEELNGPDPDLPF